MTVISDDLNLDGSIDTVGRITIVIFFAIFLLEVIFTFVIIQILKSTPLPFTWMRMSISYVRHFASARFSRMKFVLWPLVVWHELLVGYACILSLGLFVFYTLEVGAGDPNTIFDDWYYIMIEFIFSVVFLWDFLLYLFVSETPVQTLFSMATISLATVAPGILAPILTYYYMGLEPLRAVRLVVVLSKLEEAGFRPPELNLLVFRLRIEPVYWKLVVFVSRILSWVFVFMGLYFVAENVHQNPGGSVENLFEAVYFSVVTASTVGYGDISPNTFVGRLLVIVFIGGALASLTVIISTIGELFQGIRASRRYIGPVNHVIVVGNTDVLNFIVSTFFDSDLRDTIPSHVATNVVLIHDSGASLAESLREYIRSPFLDSHVHELIGSPYDHLTWGRAEITKAAAVYIVAQGAAQSEAEDDDHVVRAATVARQSSPAVPIFAVCHMKVTGVKLKALGVSKRYVLERFKGGIVAQSCLCYGSATLVSNLVRHSGNEKYQRKWERNYSRGANQNLFTVRLPKYLSGRSMREIAGILYFASQGSCLLIAIRQRWPHIEIAKAMAKAEAKRRAAGESVRRERPMQQVLRDLLDFSDDSEEDSDENLDSWTALDPAGDVFVEDVRPRIGIRRSGGYREKMRMRGPVTDTSSSSEDSFSSGSDDDDRSLSSDVEDDFSDDNDDESFSGSGNNIGRQMLHKIGLNASIQPVSTKGRAKRRTSKEIADRTVRLQISPESSSDEGGGTFEGKSRNVEKAHLLSNPSSARRRRATEPPPVRPRVSMPMDGTSKPETKPLTGGSEGVTISPEKGSPGRVNQGVLKKESSSSIPKNDSYSPETGKKRNKRAANNGRRNMRTGRSKHAPRDSSVFSSSTEDATEGITKLKEEYPGEVAVMQRLGMLPMTPSTSTSSLSSDDSSSNEDEAKKTPFSPPVLSAEASAALLEEAVSVPDTARSVLSGSMGVKVNPKKSKMEAARRIKRREKEVRAEAKRIRKEQKRRDMKRLREERKAKRRRRRLRKKHLLQGLFESQDSVVVHPADGMVIGEDSYGVFIATDLRAARLIQRLLREDFLYYEQSYQDILKDLNEFGKSWRDILKRGLLTSVREVRKRQQQMVRSTQRHLGQVVRWPQGLNLSHTMSSLNMASMENIAKAINNQSTNSSFDIRTLMYMMGSPQTLLVRENVADFRVNPIKSGLFGCEQNQSWIDSTRPIDVSVFMTALHIDSVIDPRIPYKIRNHIVVAGDMRGVKYVLRPLRQPHLNELLDVILLVEESDPILNDARWWKQLSRLLPLRRSPAHVVDGNVAEMPGPADSSYSMGSGHHSAKDAHTAGSGFRRGRASADDGSSVTSGSRRVNQKNQEVLSSGSISSEDEQMRQLRVPIRPSVVSASNPVINMHLPQSQTLWTQAAIQQNSTADRTVSGMHLGVASSNVGTRPRSGSAFSHNSNVISSPAVVRRRSQSESTPSIHEGPRSEDSSSSISHAGDGLLHDAMSMRSRQTQASRAVQQDGNPVAQPQPSYSGNTYPRLDPLEPDYSFNPLRSGYTYIVTYQRFVANRDLFRAGYPVCSKFVIVPPYADTKAEDEYTMNMRSAAFVMEQKLDKYRRTDQLNQHARDTVGLINNSRNSRFAAVPFSEEKLPEEPSRHPAFAAGQLLYEDALYSIAARSFFDPFLDQVLYSLLSGMIFRLDISVFHVEPGDAYGKLFGKVVTMMPLLPLGIYRSYGQVHEDYGKRWRKLKNRSVASKNLWKRLTGKDFSSESSRLNMRFPHVITNPPPALPLIEGDFVFVLITSTRE